MPTEAPTRRVAQHFVSVAGPVSGNQRAAAIAAGVDDEVRAAEHAGDALPVVELLCGPVSVGTVQEEPLGIRDSRLMQHSRVLAPRLRVGRAGVEVEDDVRILLG